MTAAKLARRRTQRQVPTQTGRTRIAALASIAILALAGCFAAGPSELTVHNRTSVAIVFTELQETNGVDACTSRRFRWAGTGWTPVEPGDPAGGGVPVTIAAAPMGDAVAQVAVIVTAERVTNYTVAEVPTLPPCAGEPPPAEPTFTPLPSASP